MNNKKISGIYCIENTINHKKYIGQSNNIYDRWRKHISELNNNKHHNDYLQKSWLKYGESKFVFYILEKCDVDVLDTKENYYIDIYQSTDRNLGYNLKSGGQNGGSKYSIETRTKMSNSIKKSFLDPERRKIQSINAKKQWSDSKIKEKITGKNSGMYGYHHTEEAKEKIRQCRIGSSSYRKINIPVMCIELNRVFNSASDAGKELSLDSCGILKVCRNERKTCGTYHWKFIRDEI